MAYLKVSQHDDGHQHKPLGKNDSLDLDFNVLREDGYKGMAHTCLPTRMDGGRKKGVIS